MAIAEFLEIIMVVCFGFSWPASLIKSYKARTAKGKSISFLFLIFTGYIAGIISKFMSPAYMAAFSEKWYVLVFYFINITMVGAEIVIYFRNKHLDANK